MFYMYTVCVATYVHTRQHKWYCLSTGVCKIIRATAILQNSQVCYTFVGQAYMTGI